MGKSLQSGQAARSHQPRYGQHRSGEILGMAPSENLAQERAQLSANNVLNLHNG